MKQKPAHPMEVRTGSKVYTIEQKSLTKDSLHGDVDFSKAILRIDPNQSLEDYKNTLLHEIIHIGYDMFGLGNDEDMPSVNDMFGLGNDEDMPSVNNEFLTMITGNMLRLFTNLNPELFEYIFERPK
jgi:hypothetical protein